MCLCYLTHTAYFNSLFIQCAEIWHGFLQVTAFHEQYCAFLHKQSESQMLYCFTLALNISWFVLLLF